MLDCVFFAEDRGKAHDDGCKSRLDMLIRVVDELLYAGKHLVHDQTLPICRIQGLAKLFHLRIKGSRPVKGAVALGRFARFRRFGRFGQNTS